MQGSGVLKRLVAQRAPAGIKYLNRNGVSGIVVGLAAMNPCRSGVAIYERVTIQEGEIGCRMILRVRPPRKAL